MSSSIRNGPNTPPAEYSSTFTPSPSKNNGPTFHSQQPKKVNHREHLDLTPEEFKADLYSFMERRGLPITKVPSLGYQELDLLKLYKLVIERGGMDAVTRSQEWKAVYQELNIPTMSTSASYNTRTNYKKYLYLYELEHCDFSSINGPASIKPRFEIGQYIRIISSVLDGAIFYARIVKSRLTPNETHTQHTTDINETEQDDSSNMHYEYYVHYNGWSASHDEWMPESVISELTPEEAKDPETLNNPPPTRSSKSNRIIYDPTLPPVGSARSSPKNLASPLRSLSPIETLKKKEKAEKGLKRKSKHRHHHSAPTVIENNVDVPQSIQVKDRLSSILECELGELITIQKSSEDRTEKNNEKRCWSKPVIHKNHLHTHWMLVDAPSYLNDKTFHIKGDDEPRGIPIRFAFNSSNQLLPSRTINLPTDTRQTLEIKTQIEDTETRLQSTRLEYKKLLKELENDYGRALVNDFIKKSGTSTTNVR